MTALASPVAAPPPTDTGPAPRPVVVHRLRLAAVCLVLSALAFVQDPGEQAADTKLDLVVDPLGFLGRALHLWEPLGFFGQLQNQAYGYLFPMGPFFALGDASGLPMWVVQRLWWSLLLCVAFLGVVRLARLLGVEWAAASIVAGVAYALAPRMVTELGVLSVEVLPYAVAPWVLIPLVAAARNPVVSPRRAAMLSGVALVCAGGVNAVAAAAIWPLAAWWIVTAFRGRTRVVVAMWWALAVCLSTLWWLIPLLILGRYSPPFLDWIESSSITTLITSPDTVLRGTSQWVAYVADGGGPVWPSGWQLVTSPVLILASGLVVTVGVAGLALRTTAWRLFLVGGVLLGVVLVSLGHLGSISGLGAEELRTLLDGPLAALRNTHKFDVMLRLPLCIGIGLALQAAQRRWRRSHERSATNVGRWMVGAMVLLVGISAWPAVSGGLTRGRSYADVPDYWPQVADWLAHASPQGTALLVPGASFGVYSWGRTQDEPLQSVATTPWAVRDAVPLSSAGNIRWLDAVEERIDSGRGSPGLADALARAGVRYVLVRNDVDRRRAETPRTLLVRQALIRSGHFTPVAGFGPVLYPYRSETTVMDDALQDVSASVEIWRVDSPYAAPDARVALRNADEVLVTSGSAEAVPDLADADVLQNRAVVTSGDDTSALLAAGARLVFGVTDTFRRTELNVGRSRLNRSEVLAQDDAWLIDRRVHDYLPVDPADRQTVAVYDGGRAFASSSQSAANAPGFTDPAAQPWAAIDGDPATAWLSSRAGAGVGQWWEVRTDDTFSMRQVMVRLVVGDPVGAAPATVTVSTDGGSLTLPVRATDSPQWLPVPGGPTHTLRLTLASVVDGSEGAGFGIREVDLPVAVGRRLVTPGAADGGPIVLTARRGEQTGCVTVSGQLSCSAALPTSGEEGAGLHRHVTVEKGGDYRIRLAVRPRTGPALDALLRPRSPRAPVAQATSQLSADPAVRPQSAVDGSLETAWVAGGPRPTLTIRWREPRTIRGVRLLVRPELAASRPLTVSVDPGGAPTRGVVNTSGFLRIPPRETTRVSITFENVYSVRSLDPLTGTYSTLPVGVNEVRLLGAEDLPRGPRPTDVVEQSCEQGPAIALSRLPKVSTSLTTSVGSILTDQRMAARPCGAQVVELSAGDYDIDVPSTSSFVPESLVLEPVVGDTSVTRPSAPTVEKWGPTDRVVSVEPSAGLRLLELNENANAGWVAELRGVQLPSVRVDGWRQAWIVPAGVGGNVEISYEPDSGYRAGLLLGLAAVMALGALAFWPSRRRRVTQAWTAAGGIWSRALLGCAALVAAIAVGSTLGACVALGAMALTSVLRRWWLVLLFGMAGALAASTVPWPQSVTSGQVALTMSALAALACLSAAASPWDGERAWVRTLLRKRAPEAQVEVDGVGA